MDRPTRFGAVLLLRWKRLVHAWRYGGASIEQDIARCHYESVFTVARCCTGDCNQGRNCVWNKDSRQ